MHSSTMLIQNKKNKKNNADSKQQWGHIVDGGVGGVRVMLVF